MKGLYVLRLWCLAGLLMTTGVVEAQKQAPANNAQGKQKTRNPSFMDWLLAREDATITIRSDLAHLHEFRMKQLYQPATIAIATPDTNLQQELVVKTRGKFRCRSCDLPPLKLRFHEDTLRGAGFRKWNELKLALPCRDDKMFTQWLLKEYLVYRLYNILTDRSYRVKIVDLKLEDAKSGNQKFKGLGLVIEHEEEVANRLNGKSLDTMGISGSQIRQEDYTRLQVFEFMIGNTDWIPISGHNFGTVRLKNGDLIAIPFDFDFSGLVGTSYAVPNSMTPLTSVQERYFMGNKEPLEELEKAFALFREKKEEMYAEINGFAALDARERKKMINFLESFFKIINDPRQVQKYFVDVAPFQPPSY